MGGLTEWCAGGLYLCPRESCDLPAMFYIPCRRNTRIHVRMSGLADNFFKRQIINYPWSPSLPSPISVCRMTRLAIGLWDRASSFGLISELTITCPRESPQQLLPPPYPFPNNQLQRGMKMHAYHSLLTADGSEDPAMYLAMSLNDVKECGWSPALVCSSPCIEMSPRLAAPAFLTARL